MAYVRGAANLEVVQDACKQQRGAASIRIALQEGFAQGHALTSLNYLNGMTHESNDQQQMRRCNGHGSSNSGHAWGRLEI